MQHLVGEQHLVAGYMGWATGNMMDLWSMKQGHLGNLSIGNDGLFKP